MKNNDNNNPLTKQTDIPVILAQQTMISSPFPPPEILERYKEIDTELVERSFHYTEINGQHRRELENDQLKLERIVIENSHTENMTEIKQRGSNQSRGQVFAFSLTILFLGSTLFSAFNGYEMLSLVLGGLGGVSILTNIVNAFLRKGNGKNKNDNNK
jgi:uncharacterized membrane protein